MNFEPKLLCDALLLLSLPEADQRRLSGPGCLSCDIYEDYRSAWETAMRDTTQHFSSEQHRSLGAIYEALGALTETDCECVTPDATRLPSWEAIREQARLTLPLMGWRDATVQPFTESSPGIWRRPSTQ
jgi:hypothetical protein